jgi:hypothetical protein
MKKMILGVAAGALMAVSISTSVGAMDNTGVIWTPENWSAVVFGIGSTNVEGPYTVFSDPQGQIGFRAYVPTPDVAPAGTVTYVYLGLPGAICAIGETGYTVEVDDGGVVFYVPTSQTCT